MTEEHFRVKWCNLAVRSARHETQKLSLSNEAKASSYLVMVTRSRIYEYCRVRRTNAFKDKEKGGSAQRVKAVGFIFYQDLNIHPLASQNWTQLNESNAFSLVIVENFYFLSVLCFNISLFKL